MGLFTSIKEAKRSEAGTYLSVGLHRLEVNRVKSGKNWRKKDFFVVECKVLESTNAEEHPVGSTADVYINLSSEYPDLSLAEVKHFLQVATFTLAGDALPDGINSPEDIEIGEEDAEESCAQDQPFMGLVLRAEGTRKDGKKFVKIVWSPDE